MKTINVQELIESKKFVKPGSLIDFKSPQQIIEPLLAGDPSGILFCSVDGEVVNKNEDGTENISYGRAMLSKRYTFSEGINYEVGFIYVLDTVKPMLKAFCGPRVSVCSNLCIFNATDTVQVELNNGASAYESFQAFSKSVNQRIEAAEKIIQTMKSIFMDVNTVKNISGHLLWNSEKTNVGTNTIINGIRLMQDKNSRYFVGERKDFSLWELYNAFTEYLSKKSFVDESNNSNGIYRLVNEALEAAKAESKTIENTIPELPSASATPQAEDNSTRKNKSKK